MLAEGSSEENRQEPIDEGTISLREDVVATDLKKDETKIFREVIKQSVGASNGEGRGGPQVNFILPATQSPSFQIQTMTESQRS